MISLRCRTSAEWVQTVLSDFDSFVLDHANCERKASAMAMSFVVRYPDKLDIVEAMVDLAIEELSHFRRMVAVLTERGLVLARDERDSYVRKLQELERPSGSDRLLDRLLIAGVIEARGCERFGLVAKALRADPLRALYQDLATSEARHHELFFQSRQSPCRGAPNYF